MFAEFKMKGKKDKKVVGIPDNHFPSLLSNLSGLQSREKFTDVVFLCRGGEKKSVVLDNFSNKYSRSLKDVLVDTEPC